jgi:hypothetical protein
MTGEQVINKVANDGVRFVPQFGYDAANQGSAARMPLQINRSGNVPSAMYLRPTMWTSGLFGPDFNEPKFPLQLWIIHDFVAQRFAPGRDNLDHCLHITSRFIKKSVLLQCFFHVTRAILPPKTARRQDCLRHDSSERYMT